MSESSDDDLSAVAWVHEELRRSLDAAHRSLRRFVKDVESVGGSDIDVVDPAVLRSARAQIHQGAGALELVGLPAAALALRASEAVLQRAVARPAALTATVVADIERLSFALLDYLARMLAGKPVSPLALFPQYRAVQEAADAQRVHPADLWTADWRWRELPVDGRATPLQADVEVRDALEGGLLALMRGAHPLEAAGRIGELCAGLGAGAADPQVSTLWKLAAAVFEAHCRGLLPLDVFGKRIASRLLAQFRILERGDSDVSERLARDLLFFCARSASPGTGSKAPRLAAVRQVYGLAYEDPIDYSTSALGRFDPALIALARKRVAAAKEAWSAVAAGEMHRLAGLTEQFALVGESLRRLFPLGDTFANELQQTVQQTQRAAAAPPPALAMEVATSLLYTEAVLEDADFDQPGHAQRVQHLAERLSAVREQQPAAPLEAWMEELYRRVSERQTMGTVVQELRASLADAEQHIDRYFRDPSDAGVLMPVAPQLAAMRGVLSVLGIEQAATALQSMRDEIEALANAAEPPSDALFDRLAGNLSALGFMIDMLGVQPQMVHSLFRHDAAAGTFSPVMGRREAFVPAVAGLAVEPRLIEQAQMLAFSSVRADVPLQEVERHLERLAQEAQAADQPALAATVHEAQQALGRAADSGGEASARGALSEALVDFVATATEPILLEPAAAVAPREIELPRLAISDFAEDDEMREIFLEEAREVMQTAATARAELVDAPDDLALLTTLRRAFHTLKGSSRMVGLQSFGEAAWIGEQVYNTQLAEQRAAEAPLLEFTAWALDHLGGWIDDIAARRASRCDDAAMRAAAERMGAMVRSAAPAGAQPAPPAATDTTWADSEFTLELDAVPESLELDAFPKSIALDAFPESIALDAIPEVAADAPVFVATAPVADAALLVDADLAPAELASLDAGPAAIVAPMAGAADPVAAPAVDRSDSTLIEEVTFELDLAALEPPLLQVVPLADAVEPSLDPRLQAMFEPFGDAAATAPVDLEIDAGRPEALIGKLEPTSLPLGVVESAPVPLDAMSGDAPSPADDEPLQLESFSIEVAPAEPEFVDALAESPSTPVEPVDDEVKQVGELRIGIPLFNIYLHEADELSRRLVTELAEWAMELERPLGEVPIALAHSLAGSSATVGFADLSQLARALEHALTRTQAIGNGTPEEAHLFVQTADEIRRLLHQFAAGFLKQPAPELSARLAEHELSSALRLEAATAAAEFAPAAPADEVRLPLLDLDDSEPALATQGSIPVLDLPEKALDELALPTFAAAATQPGLPPVENPEQPPRPVEEPPQAPRPPVEDPRPLGEPTEPPPVEPPPVRLDAATLDAAEPLAAAPRSAPSARFDDDIEVLDAVDAIDPELLGFFQEEALELLPQLSEQLRRWVDAPAQTAHAAACMRTLHTLKGGARLAGAMRLGEMAHRLETRIERVLAQPVASAAELEALHLHGDALAQTLEALDQPAAEAASPDAAAPAQADASIAASDAVALAIDSPDATPGRKWPRQPGSKRPAPNRLSKLKPSSRRPTANVTPKANRKSARPCPKRWRKPAPNARSRARSRPKIAPQRLPRTSPPPLPAMRRTRPKPQREPKTQLQPQPRSKPPPLHLQVATRRRVQRPSSTGRGSTVTKPSHHSRSSARKALRSRRCACAPRCSTGSSTSPARSASRARASRARSRTSGIRWAI